MPGGAPGSPGKLVFPTRCSVVGVWMQRSEERRGPRQVAFSLRNSRLEREGINVVRCNIENLIKLPQRFGKTTKCVIGKGMLADQVNVAWVEPLGFVEEGFAPLPLASPPRDIG